MLNLDIIKSALKLAKIYDKYHIEVLSPYVFLVSCMPQNTTTCRAILSIRRDSNNKAANAGFAVDGVFVNFNDKIVIVQGDEEVSLNLAEPNSIESLGEVLNNALSSAITKFNELSKEDIIS